MLLRSGRATVSVLYESEADGTALVIQTDSFYDLVFCQFDYLCVRGHSQIFFFHCSSNAITRILAPVSKRKEQFKLSVYSLHLSYVYSIWCEAQGHLALGQQPEDIHL